MNRLKAWYLKKYEKFQTKGITIELPVGTIVGCLMVIKIMNFTPVVGIREIFCLLFGLVLIIVQPLYDIKYKVNKIKKLLKKDNKLVKLTVDSDMLQKKLSNIPVTTSQVINSAEVSDNSKKVL